jgi:hypothetical protein
VIANYAGLRSNCVPATELSTPATARPAVHDCRPLGNGQPHCRSWSCSARYVVVDRRKYRRRRPVDQWVAASGSRFPCVSCESSGAGRGGSCVDAHRAVPAHVVHVGDHGPTHTRILVPVCLCHRRFCSFVLDTTRVGSVQIRLWRRALGCL